MAQLELKAQSREVLGKGVKVLRRQNITPLHLFGSGIESMALQSETALVEKSVSMAGETRLISLTVDKERKARPVLVRGVQKDPISRKLLHVDLYQVKMGEKVSVEVPIVLVGEAPALQVKGNSLLQALDSLAIESLPDKIPANVKLDISSLTEAGQSLRVKDIQVEPGTTVTSDLDQMVVIVVSRPEEKAPEKAPAAEAAAAAPAEAEGAKEGA